MTVLPRKVSLLAFCALAFGSLAWAQVEDFRSRFPQADEQFGYCIATAPLPTESLKSNRRELPGKDELLRPDWVLVGVPGAAVGGLVEAGHVELFPPPDSPRTRQLLLQAPPAHVQSGARFGAAVAAGDVDGDGIVDVVVGAPGEDHLLRLDQGRVYVFFGPWDFQATPAYATASILEVKAEDLDPVDLFHGGRFGHAVAVGDLDRQGGADIVVGAPHADDANLSPALVETGAVDVFLNPLRGATGITRTFHLFEDDLWKDTGNHYGWALAIGNFVDPQADDLGDIAVGVPDLDRPVFGGQVLPDAGLVHVHWGYRSTGFPTWDNTPGHFQKLGGTLYITDGRQGAALAAGDYTLDGWDDLAVGSPGSLNNNGIPIGPEGFVMIYHSDGTVLRSSGAVTQPLIFARHPYKSDTNLLGHSLAFADTDGTGQLDLIIGAPGTGLFFQPTNQEGRIHVAHAEATRNPDTWLFSGHNDPSPEFRAHFGWSVAAARRHGDLADVVGSAPRSWVWMQPKAGQAFLFDP
jgi:hypothetical protein